MPHEIFLLLQGIRVFVIKVQREVGIYDELIRLQFDLRRNSRMDTQNRWDCDQSLRLIAKKNRWISKEIYVRRKYINIHSLKTFIWKNKKKILSAKKYVRILYKVKCASTWQIIYFLKLNNTENNFLNGYIIIFLCTYSENKQILYKIKWYLGQLSKYQFFCCYF